MNKVYLGDAVYVEIDPSIGFILTTSDGTEDTNTIVLEPQVMESLIEYKKRATGED